MQGIKYRLQLCLSDSFICFAYFGSQKYKVELTVDIDKFLPFDDWCVLLQYCQDLGPEEFEIRR